MDGSAAGGVTPKSWDQVVNDPRFAALPDEHKDIAKGQYFNEVVAPRLPHPGFLESAKAQFMDYARTAAQAVRDPVYYGMIAGADPDRLNTALTRYRTQPFVKALGENVTDSSRYLAESLQTPEGGMNMALGLVTGGKGEIKPEHFQKYVKTPVSSEHLSLWDSVFSARHPDHVVERLAGPLKALGEPATSKIGFGEYYPKIAFSVESPGKYVMDRALFFEPDGLVAHHEILTLADTGTGLGKKLLKSQMDLYEELGVNRIEVIPGLSRGGYAWARYGFRPDSLGEEAKIFDQVMMKLNNMAMRGEVPASAVKMVQDIASRQTDRPGEKLWKLADLRFPVRLAATQKATTLGNELLSGTSWSGTLGLSDKEAINRFNKYTGRTP